jgi:hypothetical protein
MTIIGQWMMRLVNRRGTALSTSVAMTASDACLSSAGTSTLANGLRGILLLCMLKLHSHPPPTRVAVSVPEFTT